jgi:hypothetical protein
MRHLLPGRAGYARANSAKISGQDEVSTYEPGDYIKVEFPDEATGVGEWMWVRVEVCDDKKKLVYGLLDNEPLNDFDGKLELGSQLVVSYCQIRDHRKPTEFTKQ